MTYMTYMTYDAAIRCGETINWVLREILVPQWGGSTVVLLDNDMFLTAPFSVRAFIKGYAMAGIAQDKPTPCLPPPYSEDTYPDRDQGEGRGGRGERGDGGGGERGVAEDSDVGGGGEYRWKRGGDERGGGGGGGRVGGNANLHIYKGWHSLSAEPCQVSL